jgi:glutamate-ammonia-ligase adenylyltransferase
LGKTGQPICQASDFVQGAPDEADAFRRAERLLEAAAQSGLDLGDLDATAVRIATLACQRAPYLATLLVRDPARWLRVARDPYLTREKPRDVLAAEVAGQLAGAPLPAALRRARGDELVRLGVRELELGLDTEVGRELARLADACFDAAIAACGAELTARYGPPRYTDDDGRERDAKLCVIGMGKLGGDELNFASDVDVIYVYSSDHGAAGELSLHEYFAKLCTQVTAALSQATEDDVVFRVDLRLRPEGEKGAITCSLDSLERYYETFGRPWERQAWLKARPCAGDAELGAAVMRTLQPFVFPRHTAPSAIDEVRALNRRIKRELVRDERGFDVKNGEGGIREVEFFAQALQLLHAGKRPALRVRGTLATLDALVFAGLVTDDEHRVAWRGYRWLRHVEHVLQLEGGLQTQTVPREHDVLARRLGYATAEAFDAALARHTGEVARLFATLDSGETPDSSGSVTRGGGGDAPRTDTLIADILHGELPEAAEAATLEQLGFADVTAARAELARARRRPGSPLAPDAIDRAARVGAMLIGELATSADPDQGLRFLGDLLARRGEAWSVWRLIDEQPPLARLLGSLLGASAYLARTLVETPELIDLLVELGQTAPTRTAAQIGAELAARLARVDRDDPEAPWSAIAEVKAGHVLRVGLADFGGALDPLAVCTELTAIAEACLAAALDAVQREPGALAILALGKLGGRELGYAADLDVVFVYEGDDEALVRFSRLAQRLLGALRQRTPRGRLYELDTRLRPSGSQGLLVSSLAGWRRYHAESAQLWEHQALLKLRAVAGDPALGAEVERLAAETVYGAPHDARAAATAIRAMRDRIEHELGASRAGASARQAAPNGGAVRSTDLKTGAGGVIDVEFAAQYLQLVHGHAHASLRTTSTVGALRAAAQAGLAPPEQLRVLDEGYRFLRGIEHRLRVVHDQPIHRLPETKAELDKLARRSGGFVDGGALLAHVERWQRDIRAAYIALLGA